MIISKIQPNSSFRSMEMKLGMSKNSRKVCAHFGTMKNCSESNIVKEAKQDNLSLVVFPIRSENKASKFRMEAKTPIGNSLWEVKIEDNDQLFVRCKEYCSWWVRTILSWCFEVVVASSSPSFWLFSDQWCNGLQAVIVTICTSKKCEKLQKFWLLWLSSGQYLGTQR